MMNQRDILSTIEMIDQQHLDIRTVTMGISLLSCADEDASAACRKIYDRICRTAGTLVPVCEEIETEFGIPIVNKRISVTPVSQFGGLHTKEDFLLAAKTLDRAAIALGVNCYDGKVTCKNLADSYEDCTYVDVLELV